MTDGAPGLGGGDRFSFESPAPSGDPANDLVHGMRWRAGAKPSKAAVIMLHGGFAPFFAAEKLIAPPFLKAGIDVLAPALPWHMERAPAQAAYSGQYLFSSDVPRLVRDFAQGAQDAAVLAGAPRETLNSLGTEPLRCGRSRGAWAIAIATPVGSGAPVMPAEIVHDIISRTGRRFRASELLGFRLRHPA